MTGILRVAKENIFSGLNNLTVYSILDDKFSQYFGFTGSEVDEMVKYYGYTAKMPEIKEWYDGYIFGKTEIYNPWSVINCFYANCQLTAYWVNTSSNEIIHELLDYADAETSEKLMKLLEGKTIEAFIDPDVIYPDLHNSLDNVFSLLCVAGYLKLQNPELFNGRYVCDVSLPNKELSMVYNKEIIERINTKLHSSIGFEIGLAIARGNVEKFGLLLRKFMRGSMSFYDSSEAFYHGLLLGLCAILTEQYLVKSNRESGLGRFDIALLPLKPNIPSYIFELKLAKEGENLDELAKIGLEQIEQKEYITEFANMGITEIEKIGIAFRGKETAIIQS